MLKWACVLVALLLLATLTRAADVFYAIPLGDLKLAEGSTWPDGRLPSFILPTARIRVTGGEGYVRSEWQPPQGQVIELCLRMPDDRPISGTLFLGTNAPSISFRADQKPATDARKTFYQAKLNYYATLRRDDYAGAAWFRYQEEQARKELGQTAPATPAQRFIRQDDTFDFFTGGRAIAENLQLDRALATTQPGQRTIDVDTLPGISVAAMDFASLNKDASPAKDPLASYIPADQHAIFFPSVAAAKSTFDQLNDSSLPIIQALSVMDAKEATVLEQYQRQLGLRATKLAELLGPSLVSHIAITGSDPFFPTGTDVAILFDSPNPAALRALLVAQITLSAAQVSGTQVRQDQAVTSFISPDRQMSSYLGSWGNLILVTNSPAQLKRLTAVSHDAAPKLADSPEYTFFRTRYALGESNETALLVLSDAAIRRWCSARWRIGEARRTQALALMAQSRAQALDAAHGNLTGKVPTTDTPLESFGRLGFLTPISELDIAKVSQEEADAYARWRDNYQRNWRGSFDPIAIRFSRTGQRIAADLTVMPLIASTDYREIISLARGATLASNSGDPHDALGHFVLAINRDSSPVKQWVGLGRTMMTGVKIDPLSWLGSSIALYADDDAYWNDLAAARDKNHFMQENLGRLPLALRIESTNSLKLAAFMAGIRTMVEQSAPGLTAWEPIEHAGLSYVKVTSKQPGGDMPDFAICYAALPDSLLISLNEKLVQRALDRAAARSATSAPGTKPIAATATTHPWLGATACLQTDGRLTEMLFGLSQAEFSGALQRASWSNLAILNEWKQLAPVEDPVALHERWWGEHLICPAGGKYVWNEKLQTMESTATGCPESPKTPDATPLQLKGIRFANFGLTLENQGLRAEVQLDLQPR